MIFGLVNRNSGPSLHRILMPLLLMPDTDVYITNAVEEKNFEEKRPTWIYYNRMISDEVLALQSKYHFQIAVDVDDWWHLDPHHIMYEHHMAANTPLHQTKHLEIADVVTTTHERLAEKVYEFNKNVVIVPNAIPQHEYFPVVKTESEYTRIFWQGSITHERDIALLRNPIKRLDAKKFMMVMAGHTNQVEWDRMASMYTNGMRLPGVVLPGVGVTEYYRNYQYADVCVCPLIESPFNAMKSNLKVLEAAHSGLPVIASDVHPYKGMPLMYVGRQGDWYRWLNDVDGHKEHAAKLSEYVRVHYDFDTINEKRKSIFL
jgi:glycosyltransferase involved in cell wall biosynthesis